MFSLRASRLKIREILITAEVAFETLPPKKKPQFLGVDRHKNIKGTANRPVH